LRQLANAPPFAAAVIITLAVGMGATTAVFSVVEAVVLRPLPFAEADRVVNLHPARDGVAISGASNLEFATWRALPRVFQSVAAIVPGSAYTLMRGATAEAVTAARATSGLTEVLGVRPVIGRGFAAGDDRPGAPRVVILGNKAWRRDYDGDRGAVGKHILLDGERYEIIGVMPSSLDAIAGSDQYWVPLTLSGTDLLDFKKRYLHLVARLATGVTVGQASAAVTASEKELALGNPMWGKGYDGQVHAYADDLTTAVRGRLWVLLGAVFLVFLIACVNVVNLLLARGASRVREMAVRVALGADGMRLLRQSLTEGLVISAIAGILAIGIALGLVRQVIAFRPAGIPRLEETRVDSVALVFTIAIAGLCTLLSGILPSLRSATPTVLSALRESRGTSESRGRARFRAALVAGEIALAMALLTGAGLLIRTAWTLSHLDPGFRTDHVLAAQIILPQSHYRDLPSAARAYRELLRDAAAIPGVARAALTSSLPLSPGPISGVGAEGQPMTDGERLLAPLHIVSPGYFEAMGIRLVAGRDFVESDNGNAPNVAIINQSLARKLWPTRRDELALGERIEGMDPSHQHFMTIIGIVADIRDVGLEQEPSPAFYIPVDQTPPALWTGLGGALNVVVRTTPEPASVALALRRSVADVDPSAPLANLTTMDDVVRTSRATTRFHTFLLSALSAVALLLASVGIYGVMSYSVSQQTSEIAIRMALGANPLAVAALIVRRTLVMVGIGTGTGLVLSLATTRLLQHQLYGVAPGDPLTMFFVAILLLAVSLLAAWFPTRRAMTISPVVALAE
jgi:predicted permease